MMRFVAVLSLFLASFSQAQIVNSGPSLLPAVELPPTPEVALDMEALLSEPSVTAESVSDPLWTIEPQPGRRLLQIPLVVTPLAEKDGQLGAPPISLRGGRFIAWRIPSQDPDPPRQADEHALPHLARRLTVTADGQVRWKLERNIPGGMLTSNQTLYQLKIDGQALHELQPQRPKLTKSTDEDSRTFRARKIEADRAFRQDLADFQRLRQEVLQTPESFEQPLPERIWVVIEIPDLPRAYEFTGPSPLPWKIEPRTFETVRRLIQAPPTERTAEAAIDEDLATLTDAGRSNHPYTLRAIAHALASGNLLSQAQPNDAMDRLAGRLLTSNDLPTHRLLIGALVATIPPTPTTAKLLKQAAMQMTPDEKTASVRGLFAGTHVDARQLVKIANETLADPQGPDPAAVLAELSRHASPGSQAPAPDAMRTLVGDLALDRLTGERLDAAIAYCAAAASDGNPLASAWLNHRLLGSADPATVVRTLTLLNQVQSDSVIFAPLFTAWFGPATQTSTTPSLTLTGLIPIDTTSHALYRCLNAGDEPTRDLAWSALPRFAITQGSVQDMDERYRQILDAALAQKPTPSSVVMFLTDQPDALRSTRGLVKMVLGAKPASVGQSAARALLGSGRPIGQIIQELDPPDRAKLATVFYVRPGSQDLPPLVLGLLHQPDAMALGDWFGQQIAQGNVPPPARWASALPRDDALMTLAASSNAHVAQGAIGALVAAVGGDRRQAQSIMARFQQQPMRTAENFKKLWTQARQELYADSLAQVAGAYRISVILRASDDTTTPVEPVVLGVIDLIADAQGIRFATDAIALSVPGDRLAIRINQVGQLKNLEHERLVDLPLDTVTSPMDLLPQDDGSWVGSVTLGASGDQPEQTLEMHLDPLE